MSEQPQAPYLLKFCKTERQEEIVKLLGEGLSQRAVGRRMEIPESSVRYAIKQIDREAAKRGHSPRTYQNSGVEAPEGFIHTFSTVQVDGDGNVQKVWPRFKYTADEKEEIERYIQEFCALNITEFNIPKCKGKNFSKDIVPFIQIGDAHIGMLAQGAETGRNFDLKIAEVELCAAIKELIDQLPDCERCVINDLGDFTHYENFRGETEASGHKLDIDTRFPKMIDTVARMMRFIVDTALEKFQFVDVIINQGNHSRTNDFWMAIFLKHIYEGTDRVNVLNNNSVFITYRMDDTFVMIHHSDLCKPKDLAHVMATDYAKDWGESKFRYIDIGHMHHNMVLKEHPGVTIESFNNLAPMDKWAHDSGYRSRQSITAVLRSRKYGNKGRIVLPIEEIEDILKDKHGYELQTSKTSYTV